MMDEYISVRRLAADRDTEKEREVTIKWFGV